MMNEQRQLGMLSAIQERSLFQTVERFQLYRISKCIVHEHLSPEASIVATSIKGDIVIYNVRIYNFELELTVCHLQGNAPQRVPNLGTGSQGYVRVEKSTQRVFAVKRMYGHKRYGPLCGEPLEKERIETILVQYAITKLCAFYRAGPEVDNHIGFDLICYADCIEFHLELCRPATPEDILRDQELLKEGLRLMHSLHLIHRDVKLANILFSWQQGRCLFSDFGLSHFVAEKMGQKSRAYFEGTEAFMSKQMMGLKRLAGRCGYADLYQNDICGLLKTIEICLDRRSSQVQMLGAQLRGPKSSLRNLDIEQVYNSQEPRHLSKDRQLIEEYYGIILSGSGDKAFKELESNNNSIDCSYEFLKLKLCFMTDSDANINTQDCWESITDEQFIQVVQIVINSADRVRIERALKQIQVSLGWARSGNAISVLQELKDVRRRQQYSPEETSVAQETEKSIRVKLRVFGYCQKVFNACQGVREPTQFVKQVENYMTQHPRQRGIKQSRLRQMASVLHGDSRLQVLRKWQQCYEQEQSPSLLELVEIEYDVYMKEQSEKERLRILSRLSQFRDSFGSKEENQLLEQLIAGLTQIVYFRSRHKCNKAAFDQANTLADRMVAFAEQGKWMERAYKLNIECVYDLKLQLYWQSRECFEQLREHASHIVKLPLSPIAQVQEIRANWLLRLGNIRGSVQVVIQLLDRPLEQKTSLRLKKILTYTDLFRAKAAEAIHKQQSRLIVLRHLYQSDDFEIVECYLLLAWAATLKHDFDRGERLLATGLYLFRKKGRRPIEMLTQSEICLRIAILKKGSSKVKQCHILLKGTLTLDPELKYRGFCELWDYGERGLRCIYTSRDEMKWMTEASCLYFKPTGLRSQVARLATVMEANKRGNIYEARRLFESSDWNKSSVSSKFSYLAVEISLLVAEGKYINTLKLLAECEDIIRTSSTVQLVDLPASVWCLANSLHRKDMIDLASDYLKQAVTKALRQCYENGSVAVEVYLQGLIVQHILGENIEFAISSVKEMQNKKGLDISVSWYIAFLDELRTYKAPDFEKWVHCCELRIKYLSLKCKRRVSTLAWHLKARLISANSPGIWHQYLNSRSTHYENNQFLLEYLNALNLSKISRFHAYRIARNLLPFHHVKVTRFSSNRAGVLAVLDKIVSAAERAKLGGVREHLQEFVKDLYGCSPSSKESILQIPPQSYVTLVNPQEEFIIAALMKCSKMTRTEKRGSFRANQILLQSLLMMEKSQLTGRLLIVMSVQLQLLGQLESAKEFAADAMKYFEGGEFPSLRNFVLTLQIQNVN